MMKACKCSKIWLSLARSNNQIYRKVFETFSNVSIVLFWLLNNNNNNNNMFKQDDHFSYKNCYPTIFFLLDLNFKASLALML